MSNENQHRQQGNDRQMSDRATTDKPKRETCFFRTLEVMKRRENVKLIPQSLAYALARGVKRSKKCNTKLSTQNLFA